VGAIINMAREALSSKVTKFPVKFANITGMFDPSGLKNLISLKGSPFRVGDFKIHDCPKLSSLEGCPREVIRYCSIMPVRGEDLRTLRGAPEKVGGQFFIGPLSSIDQAELDLLKEVGKDLFLQWANSGKGIEEWKQASRGKLTARKFGI
jgi:hypothetical protein